MINVTLRNFYCKSKFETWNLVNFLSLYSMDYISTFFLMFEIQSKILNINKLININKLNVECQLTDIIEK